MTSTEDNEPQAHDQIFVHVKDGYLGTMSCTCEAGRTHTTVQGEDD